MWDKKRRNIAKSNYPSKYMYRVYNKVLYSIRFCQINSSHATVLALAD
jgi:hypothetical protein